jgi:hypothetical protein
MCFPQIPALVGVCEGMCVETPTSIRADSFSQRHQFSKSQNPKTAILGQNEIALAKPLLPGIIPKPLRNNPKWLN